LVDINNINVPGQRICSHFLVQIPRADAEFDTNKLPLIFFFLLICYFCILMYNIPTRIFTDLYTLISTTAHESVKIISTKSFMHISRLISVNKFLENFDTFCLFDLLV
jgi:hypothetical protein